MNNISELKPKGLWKNFAALNAVPRPSKHEERVIAFMVDFGKQLQLPTQVDQVGNVIIKKPATPGMENRETVVLQSHLDMVHQKNNDTVFNFHEQGIEMKIDGDWVKAKGTTLGADNGIGVATIMALLEATDIPHPALEALFTIDEETGMTGAMGLKGGLLNGQILLNLDTEDDDELTIGCAGGIDTTVKKVFSTVPIDENQTVLQLTVKGLSGGHSGMDIHKGLGNANKIMNRLLTTANRHTPISLIGISGGSLRNAIPRESISQFALTNNHLPAVSAAFEHCEAVIKREFAFTDPNLKITLETLSNSHHNGLSTDDTTALLHSVNACPNGIIRLTPELLSAVQTSTNLARVTLENGNLEILMLSRSSVDSEKNEVTKSIEGAFFALHADVEHSGAYPGWTPAPSSAIVKIMHQLYRELYAEEPKVMACHAGLECGILGQNYPEIDMISFGPNIRGAHSPDEKVQISSVQRYWDYLLKTLERIPERNAS